MQIGHHDGSRVITIELAAFLVLLELHILYHCVGVYIRLPGERY